MVEILKTCPHCGEEYSDQWGHECEGTRREAERLRAEQLAEADRIAKNLAWLEGVVKSAAGQPHEEPVDADPECNSVNHPAHYNMHPSGVECIDVIKHYNFQIGNAMKYLWRQGLKSEVGMDTVEKQIEDCEKAIWYIQSFVTDLKDEKFINELRGK